MEPTLPKISVIMPVRNEADFIERSVESMLNQKYPPEQMEIIIADGQSTDGTREIIKKYQSQFNNIRLVENTGKFVSSGLNNAFCVAKGEYVVRVDGHCEISPDYLQNCVNHLTDTNISGVGGRIHTIGETFTAKAIAIAMSSRFGVGNSAFRISGAKTKFVDTVPFPAYRKETIRETGLFDEELIRNQDDEYNYRIRELGGKILLASDLNSEYYSRSSLASLWRQYYQYGFWKVRVLQKHPGQIQPRQFVSPIFVGTLIAAGLLSIFTTAGRYAFPAIVGVYLLVNIIVSIITSARNEWRYLFTLPLAFSCLHISYGCGFLFGLVRFWNRWVDKRGNVPTLEEVKARFQQEKNEST